jgi:uracil-DNA glycosylase
VTDRHPAVLEFVETLAALHLPNTFNPYHDVCATHDTPLSPGIRRRNLELVLTMAIAQHVQSLWVARDLGYRGGRRTGLPLTDEIHLNVAAETFGTPTLQRATVGAVVSERTAAVVWSMVLAIREPVVLWNVFPLHPHEADAPFSNRCHTRGEWENSRPILESLLELLRPTNVVAIGRDAARTMEELGIEAWPVRHPSYGGLRDFKSGITEAYASAEVSVVG